MGKSLKRRETFDPSDSHEQKSRGRFLKGVPVGGQVEGDVGDRGRGRWVGGEGKEWGRRGKGVAARLACQEVTVTIGYHGEEAALRESTSVCSSRCRRRCRCSAASEKYRRRRDDAGNANRVGFDL